MMTAITDGIATNATETRPIIYPEVTVAVVTFAPEECAQIVRDNPVGYRTITLARLPPMTSDMDAGLWVLNGETAKFDKYGDLADGNHRFRAAAKSRVLWTTAVVYGVDPREVDMGRPRSFVQVLKNLGELNCSNLAATIRRVADYQGGTLMGNYVYRSTDQLLGVVREHPSLRWHCREAMGVRHVLTPPPTAAVTALGTNFRSGHTAATFFMEKLQTGEELPPGDPLLVLRRVGIDNRVKPMVRRRWPLEMFAYTVIAWNAYCLGRPLRSLRWRSDCGVFPEILEWDEINPQEPAP